MRPSGRRSATPTWRRRGYVLTLDLSKRNIGRVISAVAGSAPGAVVVHCHAGKERTGVVAALLLALAGVPDETIAEDYVASDAYLGHLYEEWAAREDDPEKRARLLHGFKSEPAHMLVPLQHLDSAGGIERYLIAAGVSAEELVAVRERLRGRPTSAGGSHG